MMNIPYRCWRKKSQLKMKTHPLSLLTQRYLKSIKNVKHPTLTNIPLHYRHRDKVNYSWKATHPDQHLFLLAIQNSSQLAEISSTNSTLINIPFCYWSKDKHGQATLWWYKTLKVHCQLVGMILWEPDCKSPQCENSWTIPHNASCILHTLCGLNMHNFIVHTSINFWSNIKPELPLIEDKVK